MASTVDKRPSFVQIRGRWSEMYSKVHTTNTFEFYAKVFIKENCLYFQGELFNLCFITGAKVIYNY